MKSEVKDFKITNAGEVMDRRHACCQVYNQTVKSEE